MKVGKIMFNRLTKCTCIIENCDNYKENNFVWIYIPLYKMVRPEFLYNLSHKKTLY